MSLEVLEERDYENLRLRKVQHHCGQVSCESCEEGQFCWFVSDTNKEFWYLGGIGPEGGDKSFWDSIEVPRYRDLLIRLAHLTGYRWTDIEEDMDEKITFLTKMFAELNSIFDYEAFANIIRRIPLDEIHKFRRRDWDNPKQAVGRVRIMHAFPKLQKAKVEK